MIDIDISKQSGHIMSPSHTPAGEPSALQAGNKPLATGMLVDATSSPSSPDASTASSEYEPETSPPSSPDADEASQPVTDAEPGPPIYQSIHKEPKYLVFESSLKQLISWCHCPECGSCDITSKRSTSGTQLTVTLCCEACNKASTWKSQPNLGTFPAGNILLSAGILFAGASVAKVLQVLNSIGVATHNSRNFFQQQKTILHPAVEEVWEQQQKEHLTLLQVMGILLVLGGDGRADSAGHSAKFGLYTTLQLPANIVLDLQLMQVRTLLSSYLSACCG